MALIGTLRSKMGTWVVVFVFVAIVAFILNDLLGNNSIFFRNDEVGVIAGHTVTYEEFQNAVQEREANYIMNFQRQPGEREMISLRQQAWDYLILRHAIQNQYGKVGVDVTVEEEEDMIYGKNVDQNIKQAFTDPQTGEFDRDRLLNYLKELNNPPADPQMAQMWQEQRTRWEMFQRDLRPARERIKYENLLVKTEYVTKAEAEREYHLQNDVAEVKFVYVPFYAVSDSAAVPSESDFQDYYNRNIEKFKTEETRDAKYVTFPIVASGPDSLEIKKDIEKIASELAQSQEDSIYAATNTDGSEPYGKYNVSSLPASVQGEDLQQGKVIGPFVDGGVYKVVKISKIYKDTIFNARAKHILIKWDNPNEEGKKVAKEKARSILKEIKAGADFAVKAREHGTDGTATRGGDLGWFSTGRMVKPFENAVFGATKPGLLNDVVETDFGYHIIFVTNVKDNSAYEIATIERKITPSDATTNAAYRKAESFAADLKDLTSFEERAKTEGLTVGEAKNVTAQERSLGSLGEARPVVQWLFRDADINEVSEIFDLQDKYVIAIMTGLTKKGNKPLDVVKQDITPEVRKDAKAKVIMEKLSALNGTLEEIASKYGSDANVYSSSDLKLSTGSLPIAGYDPETAGLAFSLENGKRSTPIKGQNGVFIIELQNKTIAPAMEDYTTFKDQLLQSATGRTGYSIGEAIKEDADINDTRYKFF
jgi:peptidyl-prolyl cis-trans isomerase D